MKIYLSNGCSHSQLSVNPTNWNTKKARVNQDWFINYRFYDSRYAKPKQVMLKGMNSFKQLGERQTETKSLIEKEIEALKNGYNPFNKSVDAMSLNDSHLLTFLDALKFSLQKVSVGEKTFKDLKYVITKIETALNSLGWKQIVVADISRKQIRLILDKASNSADRYNKNRSYLMILFSVLCEIKSNRCFQ